MQDMAEFFNDDPTIDEEAKLRNYKAMRFGGFQPVRPKPRRF
jgi:hypothetical protein